MANSCGAGLAETITGSLGACLRGAVRNRMKTAFEKRRDLALDDIDTEQHDGVDFADRIVDDQMVADALEPLDARDRYIIAETVMHLRSNAEVGRDLGITGQGVGKIKKKVLAEITADLGGEHP